MITIESSVPKQLILSKQLWHEFAFIPIDWSLMRFLLRKNRSTRRQTHLIRPKLSPCAIKADVGVDYEYSFISVSKAGKQYESGWNTRERCTRHGRPRDTRGALQIRRVSCDAGISPALLFFAAISQWNMRVLAEACVQREGERNSYKSTYYHNCDL